MRPDAWRDEKRVHSVGLKGRESSQELRLARRTILKRILNSLWDFGLDSSGPGEGPVVIQIRTLLEAETFVTSWCT